MPKPPTIILYEHPLSPYARKVKMALREKGVPFDCVLPDGMGSGNAGEEFLKANPLAEVPTLITETGTAICDSAVIMDYIEERWPSPPLLPADPEERARARLIEARVDTQMEAINWGLMEIHTFQRVTGDKAEELTARARDQLSGFHAYLERELGEYIWFGRSRFGRADLAVHSHCMNSVIFGITPPEGSALGAWYDRMNQRHEVMRATNEAIASAEAMNAVLLDLVNSGAFKRQYRDHRLEWMIRSGGMDVVRDGMAAGTIRFSHEFQ